jgi:1,4-dihydroxy-2-naphthoyl-CoA synthase
MEEKLDEITDALLHGAPGALRSLKLEMEHYATPTVTTLLARRAPHAPLHSTEAIEGIASFKEKRKPIWYPQ